MSGGAWSNDQPLNLTIPAGAGPNDARTVIGVFPIPAELVTYYLTKPAVNGITKPETIVDLTISYDGHGNYTYSALVVDSSATPITSSVTGTFVQSTAIVAEASRLLLNPGAILGGGRTEFSLESATLILRTDPGTDPGQTVMGTRVPGATFHIFSLNARGTMGWGPDDGSALTDTYLARTDVGDMELAEFLRIRSFTILTDNAFEVRLNGEGNGRLFIRVNGQLRWSDGTNPTDTTLERASAGVLTTNGISLLPNVTVTNIAPAGTQNISTTGYTSVTGVSVSLTKNYASATSSVEVEIIGQGFVSAVDNITLGVLINGTDTPVDAYRFNAINDNRKFGGIVKISGLAANTYTVQARLKVATGTTTFTTGASVTGWSIAAREVTP